MNEDTPRMNSIPRRGAFHHYLVDDVFAEGRKLERELAAALARVRELERDNEFMRKKLQKIEYGA